MRPPEAASAYTLRHSVITDLIRVRLPILTVAQLKHFVVQSARRIPDRFPLGEENGGILRLNIGNDENWSGREDSNLRPLPPEDSALPG